MSRSDYYIPVFDELPGHKKERALRAAMGWNGFESVGFLVWFWLQVAADFPDGELPGLDGLMATLRETIKAAGITPKKERIQLIAKTLLDDSVRLIDVLDDTDRLLMHDWEDGAGMFARKRLYERNKKRRQREEERRKAAGDSVPGTGERCPANVPGEKEKGKRETIPPNPPQAGGDFNDVLNSVLSIWKEECERIPVKFVNDARTKQGAADFARQFTDQSIDAVTMRQAMRGFLAMKHGGGREAGNAKSWTLKTLAKSPSAYLPKEAPPPAAGTSPVVVFMKTWRYRCETCGFEVSFDEPEGVEQPGTMPCVRRKPGKTEACEGVMHVMEMDDHGDVDD